jgi:hypothetical protein
MHGAIVTKTLTCVFPIVRKVCNTKFGNNFIFKEKLFYIKRLTLILLIRITAMKLILQLIINLFLVIILYSYNRKAALSFFICLKK